VLLLGGLVQKSTGWILEPLIVDPTRSDNSNRFLVSCNLANELKRPKTTSSGQDFRIHTYFTPLRRRLVVGCTLCGNRFDLDLVQHLSITIPICLSVESSLASEL